LLVALTFTGFVLPAVGQVQITTYHYNTNRTGWNQSETTLTPANVNSTTFGLLQKVTLDEQVDAQPLVMPGMSITAGSYVGTHDVVYVVTEHNSVYAIDVHSGTILLSTNLGTPVVMPLTCNNNSNYVGINSTPVIDPTSNTLYVMSYTQASSGPTWTLHALDLGSLVDKVTPQVVSATHSLNNGTTWDFNATYQRQRPGLLLANGNIYAGFGSFCDYSANLSRGWLMGWETGTLQPLTSNRMFNALATAPDSFFLSSVWMSGYGPSLDDSGNILVATGNSDNSGTTYDGENNIQESVIKVSPNLSSVVDLFTPDTWAALDEDDGDLGSGGVMVLPDQPGSIPHLAVAAGKDGNMYLMNEDSLGGYSSSTNNVLGTYQISPCWCGPSYYVDPSDGAARVVSSGGNTVGVWKLQTSPSVGLTLATSASMPDSSLQDPGFFTSVSSNGTANPIIWAISRPTTLSNGAPIYLFAFNPEAGGSNMTKLLQVAAGAWPNVNGNEDLIPVVANGQVFVASDKQLQIFGLTASAVATPTILPASETFTGTVSVSISDTNGAATILYTTDGSTPAPGGKTTQTYSGTPFSVTTTTTVNAIATQSGHPNSALATAVYTLQGAPTPMILPGTETVNGTVSVSIRDSNSAATILYTTDGSTPAPGGPTTQTYSGTSFSVTSPATVQAIATLTGYSNSALATAVYSVPAAPTPLITPGTETFSGSVLVSISDTNSAATILYTTDGSTPAPGGKTTQTYSGTPFSVATTTTVNAIATLTGYANSSLATATYTLLPPAGSIFVRSGISTSYTDPSGNVWVGDEDYSGGTVATPVTHAISNTTTQALYQTERFSNFAYTFPGLPVGASYVVTLKFAETYWTAAGKRIFNVVLNGTPVLSNFDIFADAGGEYIADDKTFTTTVNSSGQIVIQFDDGSADYAKVDAIELVPGAVLPVPQITPGSETFNGTVNVSIGDTNSAATILYTTNGSTPTPGGPNTQTYSGTPFSVTATTTVNAIAVETGYANSALATATYTQQTVPTPQITPGTETFSGSVNVSIGDANSAAAILYTTDGSLPAVGGPTTQTYSGTPFSLTATTTVNAIATASGYVNSPPATAVYTLLPTGPVATSTGLTSSLNPSAQGKAVIFTATVSPQSGGVTPTGNVKFLNGTKTLATVALTSGVAQYSTTGLPLGADSITAAYQGNSANSGSTSSPLIQTVLTKTTTTLTLSPNPSGYGESVTLNASVAPTLGSPPPNGEIVTFEKGGTTVLGTAPLSGGTATLSLSAFGGAGGKDITAIYPGDSSFATSTSKPVVLTVEQATTSTTLTSSVNPSNPGKSVTFTATVLGQFGGTVTGSVTFTNGATTLKTVNLSAAGVAKFSTSALAPGAQSITATYNGNTNFASSAATVQQTVN
jgi:hypothetical protein